MLCEICHKNEATCHVCTIVNGVSQSRDLCTECHEASSPGAKALSETARNASCQYCGGHPCGGGTDFLAMVTGAQKMKFMCMPCSTEHNRYVQEKLEHGEQTMNTSRKSIHSPTAESFDPASVAPIPTLLTQPTRTPTGAVQSTFRNTPGLSFTVLSATNLAVRLDDWTSLGSAAEVSPGHYQFTDVTPNSPQRFYVVRSP